MKASLSAAMARVTREPAQLGLGHDTQCAWSNGAMPCQLRREVECLEQLTIILPRRSHELNTSMQATGTKYFTSYFYNSVKSQSNVLICRQLKCANVFWFLVRQYAKVFLVDCKSGALSQVVLELVVSARVK